MQKGRSPTGAASSVSVSWVGWTAVVSLDTFLRPKLQFSKTSHLAPKLGAGYLAMRIIAKSTLREFWETHPRGSEAKTALDAWYGIVKRANWTTSPDVKAAYADASILKSGRVVFNIGGNKFRLVVRINYKLGSVYIRFVGTHREYDQIDAETI
jgi:mRNA interferase HigB